MKQTSYKALHMMPTRALPVWKTFFLPLTFVLIKRENTGIISNVYHAIFSESLTLILVTSTNFIKGTGLKKWSPPNRSFLFVTLAISPIGNEEVLDAKIAWLQYKKERLKKINTGLNYLNVALILSIPRVTFGIHHDLPF